MKKSILLLTAVCFFFGSPSHAQVSRFLNKVTKSVSNTVTGNNETTSQSQTRDVPEPKCSCEQPETVIELGGSIKLTYNEISIVTRDDGAVLVKDKMNNNFYVVKDGNRQGPFKEGDSHLKGFENSTGEDEETGKKEWTDNPYIKKSGEKYTISFGGKTYGPYAMISDFKVTKSKDKFAAYVVETMAMTGSESKKFEEEIKNAKTDQEKMEISMKMSQQMMQNIQAGGGAESMMSKLVTNIEGTSIDPMKTGEAPLNNKAKFDDILIISGNQVLDLTGKQVLSLKADALDAEEFFVNTSNTKYAYYRYGTLTFSDGTTMSELFNPYLVKINGKINIAYMYYSPKNKAIMKCLIPF